MCRILISHNSSTGYRFLKLNQIFGNLLNDVLTNGGVLDENRTWGTPDTVYATLSNCLGSLYGYGYGYDAGGTISKR